MNGWRKYLAFFCLLAAIACLSAGVSARTEDKDKKDKDKKLFVLEPKAPKEPDRRQPPSDRGKPPKDKPPKDKPRPY